MRATRSSVFVQAIVIGCMGFFHHSEAVTWLVGVLGILHLFFHLATAPKLVAVEQPEHSAIEDAHGRSYRLHRRHAPAPPPMPVPSASTTPYKPGGWS